MKIPKQFNLAGQTINVVFDNNACHAEDAVGLSNDAKNLVVLANRLKSGDPVPKDMIELTFCHEMVHQILAKMGENKLHLNEKFVSQFANYLHQAIK